ncbi:MAG: class I SAM-dependent methyltransferase [Candidatus Methanomethylophilaceae archaeon]|jgi:SAM-dependent methyltransferase
MIDLPVDSAVDLGCGPGTHAIKLSEIAHSVTAVDSCEEMLDKLRAACSSSKIDNIECVNRDCISYAGKKFDIALSCLCPPMYGEPGMKKLEELSSGICAYIGPSRKDSDFGYSVLKKLDIEPNFKIFNAKDYLLDHGRSIWTSVDINEPFVFSEDHAIKSCCRLANVTIDSKEGQIIAEFLSSNPNLKKTERHLEAMIWMP